MPSLIIMSSIFCVANTINFPELPLSLFSHLLIRVLSCHPGMSTPTPTFPDHLHGSNKRIDFLSELPLGVVMYNLVPRILGEHPIPFLLDIPNNYLDVCRTWCQRILMASGSMRCSIRSMFLISKCQELLDAAGPYVKRLDIAPISDISINQLADTVEFFSVSELTITITGSQRAYHHFFATLPNLTYLKITYNKQAYEPFQVYDILDQCTKLTRLDLSLGANTTMAISNDNQHPVYHNLVHLQVIRKERCSNDMFIPLLRHLPNLRILLLSYPPSETAMHAIHQHCPELQQLILSDRHARAVTDIVQQQKQRGLRVLRIQHESFGGDYIAKLITLYHSTLESIVLYVYSAIPVSFNEYLAIELKQLRSFQYKSGYYDPFIDWVINHAPNLESVKLLLSETQHTSYLRTLMHRPLRRVELTCEYRFHQPSHSLQPDHSQYLQHHIQLGNKSHLKEIKCCIGLHIGDGSWMYLIPKLNHLRSLELNCQFHIKALNLNSFMMELSRGCAALETITVISPLFNSDAWIHPLTLHRNLRKLVIQSSKLSDDMLIALEDFHHLGCLHLKLKKFHWNSIARLRRKVPHLKCTQLR